jgi:hypothetical protein
MYPPADPWNGEPTEPTPMYGRASVPVPAVPLREPTAEMPPVLVPDRSRQRPKSVAEVSWQKVKKRSRRNLSDGWGFTAAGLIILFCGWGLWAAAGRGLGTAPWPGLLLVLLVAFGVFVLARSVGYLVLERMWGRNRPHARWSHFLAGLVLTLAGVSYLINTDVLVDTWIRDLWDYLGDRWPSL